MSEEHHDIEFNDDDLERWANEGLEAFSKEGDIKDVEANLKKKFSTVQEITAPTPDKTKVKLYRILLPIAAAAAILLFMFFPFGTNPSPDFSTYFSPAPDMFSGVQRNESTNQELTTFKKAMEFYNQSNYEKTASLLNTIPDSDTQKSVADFYEAISLLTLDKTKEAVSILKTIQNPEIQDMNDWYLGLAYLKNNQLEDCKKIMNTIANNPKHYQHKKAKEILEKL